jgi:hypothetical protein
MDAKLLGNDDFAALSKTLADDMGSAEDDKKDTNEKLDSFLEEFGESNYYTCTILMIIDPNQEFESMRSNLKMFLLPMFQILIPAGMVWYFLIKEELFANNGYCCNETNYIFRFTGFVTFMYSGWQIIDGSDDSSSGFFLTKSVRQWSRTGQPADLKMTVMFYLGYVSQQLCCILLLIVTYVIYTSQCDTPLDLLMNCVAINFVLDIDSEWMSDAQQQRAATGAKYVFKTWRDVCIENGADVKENMKRWKGVRAAAPGMVDGIMAGGKWIILVAAYFLVVLWTFCPSEY